MEFYSVQGRRICAEGVSKRREREQMLIDAGVWKFYTRRSTFQIEGLRIDGGGLTCADTAHTPFLIRGVRHPHAADRPSAAGWRRPLLRSEWLPGKENAEACADRHAASRNDPAVRMVDTSLFWTLLPSTELR